MPAGHICPYLIMACFKLIVLVIMHTKVCNIFIKLAS